MAEAKVLCRTPTPGKKPVRIDKWKYDTVRRAILKVVPVEGDGLLFKDLARQVEGSLSTEELAGLGSVGWYTTTVKLDLEVRGDIRRVAGAAPQRLLKLKPC